MAQNIIESRLIPFNLQSGDGVPIHISPAGTMYFDRIFGLTYQNLNGISTWSLLGGGGGGSTFTGGTVTGPTNFLNGLTTTTISTGTISATTYFGLPIDIRVTGGTYNAGTATLSLVNNTGGTFSITGFSTGGGETFTGGTVSGATIFTNGLSANTFSATTYQNLPPDIFVTGGTYSAGSATFTNNLGVPFTVSGFSTGGTGTVTSVTDDGNGVCNVDNTDPSNPIIGFNGVYVDGTTIIGDGTIGNPLKATLVPGKNLVLYLDSVNQTWTATALSGDILTSAITTTQTTVTSTDNGNTRNVINFISGPDFFESTIIPDGFWLMHLFGSRNNGTVSFYTDIYYVDNDGVSNKTLIASGAGDPVPITNTAPIMLSQSLFSDVISLSDTNKRLIIEVFVITSSGNRTTTFYFRDSTISHIHTPLTAPSGGGTTFTGGTVTGPTIFTNGLSATTISATTYLGLSLGELDDVNVTGATNGQVLTYSAASQTWVPTTVFGGGTTFTGGTVSGATIFTNGLSANTISATTYQNLPPDVFVTGGTYNSGTTTLSLVNNTGGTFNVTGFTSGGGGGGNSIGQLTGDVTAGPATASSQSVAATVNPNLKTGAFGITIDGLGGVISIGQQGYVSIPYNATINGWTLLGDTTGSCVIDVWKDTFGNFPPTSGDTIAGSERPTLASQSSNRNLALTGWTTNISTGDIIGFNVLSATGITRANLIINVTKL